MRLLTILAIKDFNVVLKFCRNHVDDDIHSDHTYLDTFENLCRGVESLLYEAG